MKKKIKDLTFGEFAKIYDTDCKERGSSCEGCPFRKFESCQVPYLVKHLDEEIEVEETPSKVKDLRGCC